MVTRIGDSAHAARMTQTLMAIQERMRGAQVEVATGKRAERYDEISGDAALLLRTEEQRIRTSGFIEQNDVVLDRVHAMDGALGAMSDLAERFRAMLIQRLNDGTGRQVPLDAEADLALDEVASRLNLRLDGRYLFAGSRTDTQPVQLPAAPVTTVDPSLYYRGDSVEITVRADFELEIDYGMTADRDGFARLIAAIGQAREGHLADDRLQLEAALGEMSDAIDAIAEYRGEVGATMRQIETVRETHGAAHIYLDQTIARIEDADIAEAMSRLAQDRVALEASYLTVGQLSGLTLADYLR